MLLWVFVAGCADETVPLVEARGGGGGYWPPHSATALDGTLRLGFPSAEFDVAATADERWVLNAGSQWMDCVDVVSGVEPFPAETDAWMLAEAQKRLSCGGTPDPKRPNALVIGAPPLSLSNVIDRLRRDTVADQAIHLHLRVPDTLVDLDARIGLALDRWQAADLPHPLRISVDELTVVPLVEAQARTRNLDVTTIWRATDESAAESAPSIDWPAVERSGTDGLGLPLSLWTPQRRRSARRRGLEILALDGDDATTWRPGIDSVLTDYPGDLPPL